MVFSRRGTGRVSEGLEMKSKKSCKADESSLCLTDFWPFEAS